MEPVSASIGVGLVVSLLFTELFALSAGGMVVPGYLALVLDRPGVILLTLAAAWTTWRLVRFLSAHMIVYGRRRTALMIVLGLLIGFSVRTLCELLATPGTADAGRVSPEFTVVGYLIPGLIAIWMDRQGVVQTLSAALLASATVRLVLMTCGMEVLA